jgi:arginyl-tRNA synthetase
VAIQQTLRRILADAAAAAAPEFGLPASDLPEPELDRPRAKEHGDWATNLALILAPKAGRKPREVAEAIVRHLQPDAYVSRLEVAGPGFINLFLGPGWLHDGLREIVEAGSSYGRTTQPSPPRVQVEFVSANPTGPLHIGHARNAVLGDAIASLLEATGHVVEREYYYNNAGRQMELFGRSVETRLLQLHGREAELAEDGYAGEYIWDVAREVDSSIDRSVLDAAPEDRWRAVLAAAAPIMLREVEATLSRFGIRFDSYGREDLLHETGAIARAVDRLRKAGFAYDADGAVWFRSTEFGDDKDRVLIRSNGNPTYFGADAAYVIDKFDRGFDHLIYVWGADHHGDVKRMKGAAQALGYDPERVEIVLYQFVSFLHAGKPVQMSKRSGDLLTLDELLDEVGPDAARYTLLTRSPDSAMEFDIEQVTRQTLDNPVYYVQYAHARIASLIRHAGQRGVDLRPHRDVRFDVLVHPSELELIRRLTELPEVIEGAAEARAPHRLTRYVEEVAADFHRFYTECRVVTDDAELTQARLWLSVATKEVVGATLGLLGVSAPESMERIGDDDE